MKPEELLAECRRHGACFKALETGDIWVEAPRPLPDDLMAQLRQLKPTILELLRQDPDYAAMACVCEKPVGPTGPDRCGVCGLPMLCPGCGRCRGCRLMLEAQARRAREWW